MTASDLRETLERVRQREYPNALDRISALEAVVSALAQLVQRLADHVRFRDDIRPPNDREQVLAEAALVREVLGDAMGDARDEARALLAKGNAHCQHDERDHAEELCSVCCEAVVAKLLGERDEGFKARDRHYHETHVQLVEMIDKRFEVQKERDAARELLAEMERDELHLVATLTARVGELEKERDALQQKFEATDEALTFSDKESDRFRQQRDDFARDLMDSRQRAETAERERQAYFEKAMRYDRECGAYQQKIVEAEARAAALADAADPFVRLHDILATLKLADTRPLREVMPGGWPIVADLRRLARALAGEGEK